MRIALVTTSYPTNDTDPAGHFVRSEVRLLRNQGHQVTVICPGVPQRQRTPFSGEVVVRVGGGTLFGWPGALPRLHENPWRIVHLPGFIVGAYRALGQGDFDRVIAHWLVPSAWPIGLAFCLTNPRIPLEAVVHGSDARLIGKLPAVVKDQLLAALAAHRVHLRFVAEHLKRELETPSSQAWLATNSEVAPAPLEITLQNWDKPTARRSLGVNDNVLLAVIVARLVDQKRVAHALQYAPLPAGSTTVVVGSGPLLAALSQRFPSTRFTGQLPRPEALQWIAAADVVMSAALVEGLPTVVREARALNVPVWTAPFDGAAKWAQSDPGIRILPEFA